MLVLQVVLYFIARNRFYYSSFCFKTYFYRARHSGLLFAAPTVCRGRTNLSSLSSFNRKGFLLQSNWNWLLLNNLWCWEREGYNLPCFFVLNISPWRRQGMSVWCLCRRCCSTGILYTWSVSVNQDRTSQRLPSSLSFFSTLSFGGLCCKRWWIHEWKHWYAIWSSLQVCS